MPPARDRPRNWIEATFRNTKSTAVSVDQIRINQFMPNGQGRSGTAIPPDYAILERPDPTGKPRLDIGGQFKRIKDTGDLTVPAGDTVVLRFSFYNDPNTAYDVFHGDAFLITVTFSDGTSAVYFVVAGQ